MRLKLQQPKTNTDSRAQIDSGRYIYKPYVHRKRDTFFSRVLRDSTPRFVGPSVRPSVGPSVGPSVRHTLLFMGFCGLWHHYSCPNDQVTSITAPAHPQATRVAVYPALFLA